VLAYCVVLYQSIPSHADIANSITDLSSKFGTQILTVEILSIDIEEKRK